MNQTTTNLTANRYKGYLLFMLIACSGAFIWQYCFPNLAGQFSSWGNNTGWQREIALWNVGIISVIVIAFIKNDLKFMQILILQSTILCWLLGLNHLVSLIQDFSLTYTIHILGVFEVLLLGGIWGTFLLYRSRKQF